MEKPFQLGIIPVQSVERGIMINEKFRSLGDSDNGGNFLPKKFER
jgi:hypothetical protein